MFRTFTSLAILALTVTAAQAGASNALPARVQAAAEKACAVERFEGRPYIYHDAIYQNCVARIGRQTQMKTEEATRAKASAHDRLANN